MMKEHKGSNIFFSIYSVKIMPKGISESRQKRVFGMIKVGGDLKTWYSEFTPSLKT